MYTLYVMREYVRPTKAEAKARLLAIITDLASPEEQVAEILALLGSGVRSDPIPKPKVARRATGLGYQETEGGDHPLTWKNGSVAVHRVVLFDKIGGGDQACHWCGAAIYWNAPRGISKLQVDHLDDDRLNNDPTNLVPACMTCNIQRSDRRFNRSVDRTKRSHCRRGHEYTIDNVYLSKGIRRCRACTLAWNRENRSPRRT